MHYLMLWGISFNNLNVDKDVGRVISTSFFQNAAIIMLGTNDCKSSYRPNAYKIAKGLEQCIDRLLSDMKWKKTLYIKRSLLYNGVDMYNEREIGGEMMKNHICYSLIMAFISIPNFFDKLILIRWFIYS